MSIRGFAGGTLPVLMVTCAWTLTPAAAFAQQAATPAAYDRTPSAGEDAQSGDIIVTAQRRAQSLQEIPITATALSAEQLETRGVVNIDDISRLVPSVNFGTFGYGTQISARGVGMNLVGGEGESSVAVQMDGVPLGRPSMASLAQEDLQRVEFLLGPQGTLYGRNATAGVLNLITNDPSTEFGARVLASYGGYDLRRIEGFVTGPLTDGVSARFYASRAKRDGYLRDVTTGQKLQGIDSLSLRAALDARVTDAAKLELRGFYLRGDTAGPAYKPLTPVAGFSPSSYDLSPWRIAADGRYETNRRLSGGSAKLAVDLGRIDNVSIMGSYLHYLDDQNYDSDGTAVPLFQNSRPQKTDQVTAELLYLHNGTTLNTTVGAFYMQERIKDFGNIVRTPGFTPINGLTALSFDNRKRNTNYSLYGDATVTVSRRASVYGGLRVIWDKRAQDLTDRLLFGTAAVTLCSPSDAGGRGRSDKTALTGRLGGRYDISDSSNVFVTASRGYKSGGFNSASCADPYEPERLDSIEIGSKNRFADGRVTLNASAFYYDFRNLQVEQVVNTAGQIDNVPRSEIYGADFSAQWRASSRFQLDGNLSLLHARYVRFFYEDQLQPQLGDQNLAGKPLNRAPNWSGNFGAQYTAPLGGAGSLLLRADVFATADVTLRPANTPGDIQSSYATLAASLTYLSADRSLRVRGWVKNLTNTKYLEGVFALPLFGIGLEGLYGVPRTWGIEVSKQF